jgi:hypothetical protein
MVVLAGLEFLCQVIGSRKITKGTTARKTGDTYAIGHVAPDGRLVCTSAGRRCTGKSRGRFPSVVDGLDDPYGKTLFVSVTGQAVMPEVASCSFLWVRGNCIAANVQDGLGICNGVKCNTELRGMSARARHCSVQFTLAHFHTCPYQ